MKKLRVDKRQLEFENNNLIQSKAKIEEEKKKLVDREKLCLLRLKR